MTDTPETKPNLAFPEYLTPEEAATILRVSPETVRRRFEKRKGVIDLGTPETRHKKRAQDSARSVEPVHPRDKRPSVSFQKTIDRPGISPL
jgi:hypothetical protein